MKKLVLVLFTATLLISGASAHNTKEWRKMKSDVNLFVASDLGREGCYDQQVIANLMGEMAKKIKPQAVITTGDNHHGNGVKSTTDNDWKQNYEDVYTHPKLDIDWYPALGNHEYRGNTQAVIDYSKKSERWNMPARYYTTVFSAKGTSVRIVTIDTTPLIDKYRESKKYADANLEDNEVQLQWLDSVLKDAKEDWVIVAGHHPVYADTKKSKSERDNIKKALNGILRRYNNVSIYLCGHIHNFQHLRSRSKSSNIDYVVNSSAAESRNVRATKRTIYCSSEPGFSVLSANEKELSLYMIDKNGNVLHRVKRNK